MNIVVWLYGTLVDAAKEQCRKLTSARRDLGLGLVTLSSSALLALH